jgi:phosphonate dehydrogenase
VRLRGFGCRLAYHDPGAEFADAEPVALPTLLADSDWVVLAAPLNPQTLHMIGREALALMRPGSLLVNIARGSLVDEAAVAAALDAGYLGGYAADAFEMEDWARSDRPSRIFPALLAHRRTVFTPHLGSAVSEVRRQIVLQAAQSLSEFFAGRPMAGRL